MGATTQYAFPYPDADDPPTGPAQVQQLAEALESHLYDTGWQPFTGYTAGWTLIGSGWQARRIGRVVYVKGNVQNGSHTGTSGVMAQWPAGVTLPPGGFQCVISGNTGNTRQLVVNSSGGATVFTSGATAAYYTLDGNAAPAVA